MNTKVLLATLAGGIAYFFLGWLVFGMLLLDYSTVAACAMRAETDFIWWSMIISCLLWAWLIALVCNKWPNGATMAGGATVGLILGLLSTAAANFSLYSMTTMNLQHALIEIVAGGVVSAIVGAIVGAVLGMRKNA